MLVLKRKRGEKIRIGSNITISVMDIDKDRDTICIGISAPISMAILREEIYDRYAANDDQLQGYEAAGTVNKTTHPIVSSR